MFGMSRAHGKGPPRWPKVLQVITFCVVCTIMSISWGATGAWSSLDCTDPHHFGSENNGFSPVYPFTNTYLLVSWRSDAPRSLGETIRLFAQKLDKKASALGIIYLGSGATPPRNGAREIRQRWPSSWAYDRSPELHLWDTPLVVPHGRQAARRRIPWRAPRPQCP